MVTYVAVDVAKALKDIYEELQKQTEILRELLQARKRQAERFLADDD